MTLEFQGCTKPTPGQSTNGWPGPWEIKIFTSHRMHIYTYGIFTYMKGGFFCGTCIGIKYIIHGWFENIRNQHFDHPILGIQCTPQGGTKNISPYDSRHFWRWFPAGVTHAKEKDDILSSEKSHIEWSHAFGANLLRIFSSSFPRFVKCCAVLKTSMPAHVFFFAGVSWEFWRVKFVTNLYWFRVKLLEMLQKHNKFCLPFCYMYDTFTCMWRKSMANV